MTVRVLSDPLIPPEPRDALRWEIQPPEKHGRNRVGVRFGGLARREQRGTGRMRLRERSVWARGRGARRASHAPAA